MTQPPRPRKLRQRRLASFYVHHIPLQPRKTSLLLLNSPDFITSSFLQKIFPLSLYLLHLLYIQLYMLYLNDGQATAPHETGSEEPRSLSFLTGHVINADC